MARLRSSDSLARANGVQQILWRLLAAVCLTAVTFMVVKHFRAKSAVESVAAHTEIAEEKDFGFLLKTAGDAVRKGDWVSAKEWANEAAAIASQDLEKAEVFNLKGIVFFQQGNNADAVAMFLKGIKLNPRNPAFYQNWAEALRAENLPDAAIPVMGRALALKPDDFLLKVKWGLLMVEAGQGKNLAEQINELSSRGDLKLEWGFAKAVLLAAEGRRKEAEEILLEVKSKLPVDIYEACLSDSLMVQFLSGDMAMEKKQ